MPGEHGGDDRMANSRNEEARSLPTSNIDTDEAVELDAKVTMRLGRQLSSFYGELVKQPVPDEFLKLLEELDKREGGA